jgi:glycosyltransferase involved in cell wall biosynthesis
MQVAYCGGFEAWHGIRVLIRAVRNAVDHGCNLHVTLIGSGNEENKIVEFIQELGLESSFTLTGQVSLQELARYLAQADVGVSPYCGRVEFSGLKLLDYKAAGLATIASGANGQPAVLAHQRTGWIVPPCDEIALTQAILALAQNPHLRARIGQEARIEAESIHSWRHTTEQLLDIFNCVRKNHPSSEQ